MSVAWQGWPVPALIVSEQRNGQCDRQRRHRWRSCGNAAGPSVSSSHATGNVTGKKQVGGLTGVFTQGSGTGPHHELGLGQAGRG